MTGFPADLRALASRLAKKNTQDLVDNEARYGTEEGYPVDYAASDLKYFYTAFLDEFLNRSFRDVIDDKIKRIVEQHYDKVIENFHIATKTNLNSADFEFLGTRDELIGKLQSKTKSTFKELKSAMENYEESSEAQDDTIGEEDSIGEHKDGENNNGARATDAQGSPNGIGAMADTDAMDLGDVQDMDVDVDVDAVVPRNDFFANLPDRSIRPRDNL